MSFVLPDLPYPSDALKPYLSAETLEYHQNIITISIMQPL
jgi:superoxide dismutase